MSKSKARDLADLISSGKVKKASIDNDAIDSTKIADNAVDSEHYADGSIDTIHVADSAVTTSKIADDSVTTTKIADGAVTAAKIADGAAVPSQTGQAGKYLTTDGTTATWGTVTDPTPASVSDEANTSTGYFDVPAGTQSQRPVAPSTGNLRYNTDLGYLEQYTANGWQTIAAPPTVSNITPSTATAANTNITINGSNFEAGATVTFIGADGTPYASPSVTVNSASQIVAQTPNPALSVANEPYSVKVTNTTSLSATLNEALDAGSAPNWSTASGNLGTVFKGESFSSALSASDADGQSVSLSLTSGSLPGGLSLSGSTISGTENGSESYASGGVTKSFIITASDGVNSVPRSFNILKRWKDGSSSSLAAAKASDIANLGITTDGAYWINTGSGAFQVYCMMSWGGYMLAMKIGSAQNVEFSYGGSYWSTSSAVNESRCATLTDEDSVSRLYYEYTMGTGMRISLNSVGNYLNETSHPHGRTAKQTFTTNGGSNNGRTQFMSWMAGAGTAASNWDNQPHCNQTGFNFANNDYKHRYGITMNNENDCSSNDSGIGLGAYSNNNYNHTNGVRNANAGGWRWNGDTRFPHKGYVWVK